MPKSAKNWKKKRAKAVAAANASIQGSEQKPPIASMQSVTRPPQTPRSVSEFLSMLKAMGVLMVAEPDRSYYLRCSKPEIEAAIEAATHFGVANREALAYAGIAVDICLALNGGKPGILLRDIKPGEPYPEIQPKDFDGSLDEAIQQAWDARQRCQHVTRRTALLGSELFEAAAKELKQDKGGQ